PTPAAPSSSPSASRSSSGPDVQVHIDRESCSGTGTCVRLVPEVLRMVKDGLDTYAEVIPGAGASEEQLWEAAEACPWAAVILESDDGQVLFP
ncbi:MAG TPA: ferredoxin, partial [Acidimicrobiia bacterium]|nr:ferredoxin [Acidimicrobiia bacterium]